MKQLFVLLIFIITLIAAPSIVFAQGMMSSASSPQVGTQSAVSSDGHTAREEAEGKEIWEKLQAKQLDCTNLTDDNYGSLGEYFMGQMAGEQHEAMNNMMIRMMGEDGEKQMHIAIGKRMSGCEPNAPVPQNMMSSGMMPMMMNMMMGSDMMEKGGNPMMGTGWGNMMGGWGIVGWLSMLIFWVLLILGVIALIHYLGGSRKRSDEDKSPLDILKERYARGEIGRREFEEMKKDLR